MNQVRIQQAIIKALKTRKSFGYSASDPICPFNLAESMGFDVRFVDIPSFEGMYVADKLSILISAERPVGRKRFTCAHEIGHHVLGHGTSIDEILHDNFINNDEEKEADIFAGMLLMPKSAADKFVNKYGKIINDYDQTDFYIMSGYFGVGYLTLLTQLMFSLRMIEKDQFEEYKKIQPKKIKDNLMDDSVNGEVYVLGDWWQGRAIDVEIGDYIIMDNSIEWDSDCLEIINTINGKIHTYIAKKGIFKLIDKNNGNSIFCRATNRYFIGQLQYRYEEDL